MIYLGSDHGGFDLKEKIKRYLTQKELSFTDVGNSVYDPDDDYPQYAIELAKRVTDKEREGLRYPTPWKDRAKGILFCRSAAGVVIAANKVMGARAVNAHDGKSCKHARENNDANIIALSGDWLTDYDARALVDIFIETEFSGIERHFRRIKAIEEYEKIER